MKSYEKDSSNTKGTRNLLIDDLNATSTDQFWHKQYIR